MPNLNFVCPNCGGTILEEILSNAVATCEIESVGDEGDIVYKSYPLIDHHEEQSYGCFECGCLLKDENGCVIHDVLDLRDWLNAHQNTTSKG